MDIRNATICLLGCVIIFMITSCTQDEIDVSGIDRFEFQYKASEGDCPACNERYYFSFDDKTDAGGRWYWIGIENEYGYLAGYSKCKYFDPPVYNVSHYVDVSYFFDIMYPGEDCCFNIYLCNSPLNAGDQRESIASSMAYYRYVDFPYSNKEYCEQNCCNKGRRYAGVFRNMSGLLGARAKIKTRFGMLCSELNFVTDTALGAAWISISNEPSAGSVYHAQMGYSKFRSPSIMPYETMIYAEMGFPLDSVVTFKLVDVPPEGEINEYDIFLDDANGIWTFHLNDSIFAVYGDPIWQSMTGQSVSWSGEIRNYEDDMPGTTSHPCTMTLCKYNKGEGWQGAFTSSQTNPPTYYVSDFDEWEASILDSLTLHIWDKNTFY